MIKQIISILRKIKYKYSAYSRNKEKNNNLNLEYETLKQQEEKTVSRFLFNKNLFFPCLNEKTPTTNFDRHYIYHPAWAARKIIEKQVNGHVDIASSLSFISMLSASVPVKFYDIRPPKLVLPGLESTSIDLTDLKFPGNSISSLSCMHTIEHIGLGRYGDSLNYNGDIKAIKELSRVLATDGQLYIVVPIAAEPKLMFNAHRIYTKEQIINEFEINKLTLEEFTLIPDDEADGGLVTNPTDELLNKQNYACGCFIFTKKK